MLLLPESALLLIGGRFYRPLQVTDIWLFDLQCLNRVDKLAHAHRTRQEVFLILKRHVIAEIIARCCAPRLTERDFLPAVIIFQVFALSFRTDELAALGHNQNIGVVLDKAVNYKVLTCNISVPPADIRQGGQLYNQLLLQFVHVTVLCCIQRTGIYVGICGRMDRVA